MSEAELKNYMIFSSTVEAHNTVGIFVNPAISVFIVSFLMTNAFGCYIVVKH